MKRYLVFSLVLLFSGVTPASATDLVSRLTRVSHSWDRQSAIDEMQALDKDSQKKLVPGLRTALKDGEPYVRQNAVVALGYLDQLALDAVNDLKKLKSDPAENVRKWASASLARMGYPDKSFIETLITQLQAAPYKENGSTVKAKLERYEAANMLGFIGSGAKHTDVSKAFDALSKAATDDPDDDVRNSAATALGLIGKEAKATIPFLVAASHNPKVKDNALWAIKQIQKDS